MHLSVFSRVALGSAVVLLAAAGGAQVARGSTEPPAHLEPTDSVPGYVAWLLINETPFPGERGWVSEADTRAAMLSILWVLNNRFENTPPGYRQEQIAAVRARDIQADIYPRKNGVCDSAIEVDWRFDSPRLQS